MGTELLAWLLNLQLLSTELPTSLSIILLIELVSITIIGSAVLVNLVILLISKIIDFFRRHNTQIKDSSKKFVKELQEKDFSYYVDLVNLMILLIVPFILTFNKSILNIYYILIYIPLYLTSKVFIWLVGDIIFRGETGKISEFWFFKYVMIFCLIILAFIFSFSLFYNDIFSLNQGYMSTSEKPHIRMSFKDTFLYSGFTFFSMEYQNFKPQKVFAWFTFVQLFISQILLITFIGVMASKLIDKLELNRLKSKKNDE